MTIHKLNPDKANVEARPFSVGVSFNYDLQTLADAVFQTRAIQAFDSVAQWYPIQRVVRCAARRKLEDVFDDLALGVGLAAQRLDTGTLLLDGPGVFVHADGWLKAGYSSCRFNIWGDSKARVEEMRATLLRVVGDRHLPEDTFVLDWQFCNSRGVLTSTPFEEIADPHLLDEAYPTLGQPSRDFIQRYLNASETILILQGPPGSGKTRLVRAILAALSRRKGDAAEVMYTAERRALAHDEIFIDFITGSHDAFVIEDADYLLKARDSGNQDLHRFLSVADGVVRAQGRKIIFTTNLASVRDIDDALLRPGRCFATVCTRFLTQDEAQTLLARLSGADTDAQSAASAALAQRGRSVSVADVYRAWSDRANA
jgi:guanylate kinase